MTPPRPILFTDLDGTLLDHSTYLPGPAAPALASLREAGIPVVFCSAKTRAEQVVLRRDLGVVDPFVVENGAAVCRDSGPDLVLGLPYADVRRRLRDAAGRAGVPVRGYGDMSAAEVAERTGLDREAARRAMQREFTETFVIPSDDPEGDAVLLARTVEPVGLHLLRGARFLTALGSHDKGLAVQRMMMAARARGPVTSFAVGDFHNDTAMLAAVDHPMLVQQPDATWADIAVDGLTRLEAPGPAGFRLAAERVIAFAAGH